MDIFENIVVTHISPNLNNSFLYFNPNLNNDYTWLVFYPNLNNNYTLLNGRKYFLEFNKIDDVNLPALAEELKENLK